MKRLDIVLGMILMTTNVRFSQSEGVCRQVNPLKIYDACKFGNIQLIPFSNISIIDDDNCNIVRSKNEFQRIPKMIRFPNVECPGKYAVFLLDPDVPGYKPGRFYNHLTLSSIDCEDLKIGRLNSAVTNLRYEAPNPPTGSGTHRYMLLIYKQQPSSESLGTIPNTKRSNWSLEQFLSMNEKSVCGPIAGTQFRIIS